MLFHASGAPTGRKQVGHGWAQQLRTRHQGTRTGPRRVVAGRPLLPRLGVVLEKTGQASMGLRARLLLLVSPRGVDQNRHARRIPKAGRTTFGQKGGTRGLPGRLPSHLACWLSRCCRMLRCRRWIGWFWLGVTL